MKRILAIVGLASLLLLVACPKGGDRHVNVGDFTGGGDAPASTCTDDPREEDDEVAYVLAKTSKNGEKFDAMSCPGDDDFIHLFGDGRTSAAITWNPSEGDVRVDVLDETGAVARAGNTDLAEATGGRVFVQQLNARRDLFLRIRNRAGTPVKYHVEVGASASDVAAP